MALTQKLEFRQSQSLVMTPQLMQAIKLLQLSNVDLSAFVEEELERNPLLERASEDPDSSVTGGAAVRDAEYSEGDEAAAFADHGAGERTGGQDLEPAPDEWMNRDLGSRAEIEQTFDSGLENVFQKNRLRLRREPRRMPHRSRSRNGAAAPPAMIATISKR